MGTLSKKKKNWEKIFCWSQGSEESEFCPAFRIFLTRSKFGLDFSHFSQKDLARKIFFLIFYKFFQPKKLLKEKFQQKTLKKNFFQEWCPQKRFFMSLQGSNGGEKSRTKAKVIALSKNFSGFSGFPELRILNPGW